MALKEYTAMSTSDWVQTAGKMINAYIRARNGTESDENQCNGIVRVSGYVNSKGNKVEPYERICPYHYQGGKQDKESVQNDKKIKLVKNFSPDSNADKQDVINLKTILSKMNYYKADSRSEKGGVFHAYPNASLVSAIKQFQRDNGITPSGIITKGDATEMAINSKFSSHGGCFEYPVNTDADQFAVFDGSTLNVYQNNKKIKSWAGVSGKPNYQSPQYQREKDKGPLPEGTYVARQSELYYFNDMSKIERMASYLGKTKFPGGRTSWGNSKISLEPSSQNNMYGRKNFTVHGGKYPGSKGCIDLTSQMDDFTKWFTTNKKDLIIKVKYK